MPYKDPKKRAEYVRNYARKNKSQVQSTQKRYNSKHKDYYNAKSYEHNYGLTIKDVQAMWDRQRGLCGICGKDLVGLGRSVRNGAEVDHDHVTKKVRGLLHHGCNVRLSTIENKKFLSLALAYLDSYSGV